MTPTQSKHLRLLIADQVDAERYHAMLQALNDIKRDEAHEQRTFAARRVVEYIDLLTEVACSK